MRKMRVFFLLLLLIDLAACHLPRPSPSPPPAFLARPGSVVTVIFSDKDPTGAAMAMRVAAVVQRIDPHGVALIGAEKQAGDGGLWFTGRCPLAAVSPTGEIRREDLYDFHFSSRAGPVPVTHASKTPAY